MKPDNRPIPSNDFFLKIYVILVFAGVSLLIVLAARGDLWFDELWSVSFAERARSPLDVFLIRHDNNHLLNTFFLYFVESRSHFIVYRLLSIFSGIVSLLLIIHVARNLWGGLEALLALSFFGFSFPLILMFSEARGYAPAVMFSLLAFISLLRVSESVKPLHLMIFWAACILGTLAHATFVIFYFALFAYSLYRIFSQSRERESFHAPAIRLLCIYGLPTAFMTAFYVWFLAPMQIGGGPVMPLRQAILQSMSFPLRQDGEPGVTIFTGAVTALVVFSGNYLLYRQKDPLWVFFSAVLIVGPLLFVIITRPEYFSPRYFTVCLPFFYLLAARLLFEIHRVRNRWGPWLAAVIITAFIAGNTQQTLLLISKGRGNYKAALETIAACSSENIVTIGNIIDETDYLLITFYSRFLDTPSKIKYLKHSEWGKERPDWIIAHGLGPRAQPLPLIILPRIGSYRLFSEYRYSGYGPGWHWFVYRKAEE